MLQNNIDGIYALFHSTEKSLVLSLSEKSDKSEIQLQLKEWKNEGNEEQLFYFLFDKTDESYTIINLYSSKAIGVLNNDFEDGMEIIQNEISFKWNYKWNILKSKNGFKLQLKCNEYYIGIEDQEKELFDQLLFSNLDESEGIEFKLIKQTVPSEWYFNWIQMVPKTKKYNTIDYYDFSTKKTKTMTTITKQQIPRKLKSKPMQVNINIPISNF